MSPASAARMFPFQFRFHSRSGEVVTTRRWETVDEWKCTNGERAGVNCFIDSGTQFTKCEGGEFLVSLALPGFLRRVRVQHLAGPETAAKTRQEQRVSVG